MTNKITFDLQTVKKEFSSYVAEAYTLDQLSTAIEESQNEGFHQITVFPRRCLDPNGEFIEDSMIVIGLPIQKKS